MSSAIFTMGRHLPIASSQPCIIALGMSEPKKPQAILSGPERELQIYTLGLSGGKPSVPVPLELLEQKAKEILPPRAYDYVAGGAGGEATTRADREDFYRWRPVPPMVRDVS